MTTRQDPVTGEIEVRVVLYVKVDPRAWAENMMGDHPDEVLHRDVRASVKKYVRGRVAELAMEPSMESEIDGVPISSVQLESPYR